MQWRETYFPPNLYPVLLVCSMHVTIGVQVCVAAQVDDVVQEVLKRHGRIDGVVNCVGSVVARSALATDLEELRQTLDVSN